MRDSISFWTDLSWDAFTNFLSKLFCKIRISEKKLVKILKVKIKFSLLDRRSLFSDHVTYYEPSECIKLDEISCLSFLQLPLVDN